MEAPSSQPLNLCYCYAYEDRKHAQDLNKHLTALKMSGSIQTCSACEFDPSGFWDREVATHIHTAHLVLLLISASFLSSEERYHPEIVSAMQRHDRGEARVIPIHLSHVELEGTYLSELRMLPSNHESITDSRDRARAYKEIAQEVRQVADAMLAMKDAKSMEVELADHQLPPLVSSPSDRLSLPRRPGGFLSISWSPQANWLAVGTTDGTVWLWNVQSRSERYALQGHTSDVYSVAWSANNQLASSSADKTARLWDTSEKRTEPLLQGHILQSHTSVVNSVTWSPDGKQLASVSTDKTLRLWDTCSGTELRALTGHTHNVMSVAWSPDGKLLVSGSRDQTVRVWDSKSGREVRPSLLHQADIMSVAWSPNSNNKLLAVGSGDHVRLWDMSTRSELHLLRGHTGIVTTVAWSPDGKFLASSSRDQTVCLWDPSLGKQLRTLQGHMKGILGITWSPDGKFLATVSYDELYVWSAETGGQIATLDNQQTLRTITHQPSRTLRADTMPYDDEAPGEFQQQEIEAFQQNKMEIQEKGVVKDKQALVCPYCHTPLPEKQVNNRRKRGLRDIVCGTCQMSVLLLARQEQPDDKAVSGSAQSAGERIQSQSVQAMLQYKIDTQAFDVFLCYNNQDKLAVKRIGEQLKLHGLLPWLDEWNLEPGQPWQRALEEQIRKIKAAAVFVGPQGMGPWHDSEMYAFLRQAKKRNCRVIPVLLPGVPEEPELPVFLEEMFQVDFRLQEPDPMQQLRWGITGKK